MNTSRVARTRLCRCNSVLELVDFLLDIGERVGHRLFRVDLAGNRLLHPGLDRLLLDGACVIGGERHGIAHDLDRVGLPLVFGVVLHEAVVGVLVAGLGGDLGDLLTGRLIGRAEPPEEEVSHPLRVPAMT